MRRGDAFSTLHRIIDTGGRTHWVIVVGDRMLDDTGAVPGTAVSEVTKSRAVIEQAKGVLMAAYGISADRAFDILVWRSQETNINVRDLAARFLAALVGGVSCEALSQVDHTLLTLQ